MINQTVHVPSNDKYMYTYGCEEYLGWVKVVQQRHAHALHVGNSSISLL